MSMTTPTSTTTPALAPASDASLPFRAGTPEQLARLRAMLREAGFTFSAMRRHELDVEAAEREGRDASALPRDVGDVLRELFTETDPLPWATLRAELPPELLDLLLALGLVEDSPRGPGLARATVMVSPLRGLYLLSDRAWVEPNEHPPTDLVFSPLTTHTQHAVALMPADGCDALLEVCSGSGVGALDGARRARWAWAVDITERSTRFAEMNARLNAIENATALRGDLYEPVRGLTFDRILAHPPYMPAFQTEMIFRDGGADGEQITRRIIEGLPEVLRPGGRLYCVCLATDREGAPLEQRVRGWLGEHEGAFDVMVVETQPPENPTSFYALRAYQGTMKFGELEARDRFFKEAQVTQLVMVMIVVQRRASERPAFTVRRRGGPATVSAQVEWALRWETAAADPGTPARLVDVAPRVSDNVAVRMTHRRRGGEFVPTEYQVVVETPFRVELSVKAWLTTFLARCDGRTTVREHLAQLQEKHIVPADVTPEHFAEFVMKFVGDGIVELPGHEVPRPALPVDVLCAGDAAESSAPASVTVA